MARRGDYPFGLAPQRSDLERALEQQRLSLGDLMWAEATHAAMDSVFQGLNGEINVLDVGAGNGAFSDAVTALSMVLGHRIGVTSADVNCALLKERHNPVEWDVERLPQLFLGQFDVVHCRMLLAHVANRSKAVFNMAGCVKPGGWLVLEELVVGETDRDWLCFNSSGVMRSAIRVVNDYLMPPHFDPETGSKLAEIARELGPTEMVVRSTSALVQGGGTVARWLSLSFEHLLRQDSERSDHERIRPVDREAVEHARTLLANPRRTFMQPTMVSVLARLGKDEDTR